MDQETARRPYAWCFPDDLDAFLDRAGGFPAADPALHTGARTAPV
ncbi:hypothetical protein GCM10018793_00420 [Streptomyces sulfonofaciens]|uniref:Uncharacterized protein n=1 Tax=Streptomyces sulfonofaciens TaxID=68272 RepID=A0A919FN93_9ACTN|nr:hypothetical protein [Streptomyces sulfonofaciens]GHH68909.1 hypothetical protein GCM10018793_00420 [Streptomyces sulfonofaciens]